MNLISFRGRPAAGKTTISKAFAFERGLMRLCKDDIYDSVAPTMPDHGALNRLSHDLMYRVLEANQATNLSIVLDFPFQRDADLTLIQNWSDVHDVALISILVTCSDPDLWAKRLSLRADNPEPNQTITDYAEMERHYGSMQIAPAPGEQVLDSVQSVEALLAELRPLTT